MGSAVLDMLSGGTASYISIHISFRAWPPDPLLQSSQCFLSAQMAAKGAVMQLAKHDFVKTTHNSQYQKFPSMQQLVEGWVITLTIQMKVTIIVASMCKKTGEVLINMLLAGDTCQAARFENNKVEPAKSIRYSRFRPRPVLKGEFVGSKEFHPMHLPGRKVGLGGQVGQGPVVSKDSVMLAINIGPPFLDGHNDFQ